MPLPTRQTSVTGSFIVVGPGQSVSLSSLTVTMPNATALTLAIPAQTDQSNLNGAQVSVGQQVKVDVIGISAGLSADKMKFADAGDQADANRIALKTTTTQAIGSNHLLHFSGGNRRFSYALSTSADLSDFHNTISTIASGTAVKVKVQFSGTTGPVIKVSNASN
jgi:hypothetical protein